MFRSSRTPKGVGLFSKPRDETEQEEDIWEDCPWPARNSPVFNVLNKFLERCNDVLELVEVSQQFERIKNAVKFGGAGDINLNSHIVDIVSQFDCAFNTFNKSVKVFFNFNI